ncbi:MAG: transglutaminase-like cysteine peptidase [Alphaproteobacteria bacterium]
MGNFMGILGRFTSGLRYNRLGDLLVSKGLISKDDLQSALDLQGKTQQSLGSIFIEKNMISRWQLGGLLCQQYALRTCAAALFLSVSGAALAGKKAEADSNGLILASASKEFSRVSAYPSLLGTSERRDRDLSAFTKWTGMFKRFDRQLRNSNDVQTVRKWQASINQYEGQSIKEMARGVNTLVNSKRYVLDNKNYGKSDYWATPVEFLARGGDCEDFAIAKYVALRSLGVPESRMRLAIVQDTQKNIPHAVLVVYTNDGAVILDNQIKTLVDAERKGRYEPIFSINRQAWWLHKKPTATMVASAR